eukprot:3996831-Amphidinium_carterae.1
MKPEHNSGAQQPGSYNQDSWSETEDDVHLAGAILVTVAGLPLQGTGSSVGPKVEAEVSEVAAPPKKE